MRELATIPGVAGVHIMAPGNEAAIADVIRDAAGSSGRSSARIADMRSSSPDHRAKRSRSRPGAKRRRL